MCLHARFGTRVKPADQLLAQVRQCFVTLMRIPVLCVQSLQADAAVLPPQGKRSAGAPAGASALRVSRIVRHNLEAEVHERSFVGFLPFRPALQCYTYHSSTLR